MTENTAMDVTETQTENKNADNETISEDKIHADAAGNNGIENKDKAQKLFTQAQLENLLCERMKRERKNARSLNSLKTVLKQLRSNGILDSDSYSDMADELCRRLGSLTQKEDERQNGTSDEQSKNTDKNVQSVKCDDAVLNVQPQNTGENAENTIYAPGAENRENEACAEKEQDAATVAVGQNAGETSVSISDLFELKERCPNADVGKIFTDKAFFEFSKGRSGSLCERYLGYLGFMSLVSGRESVQNDRSDYSGAASTAFSSDGKAYAHDYSERLTRRQMDIAKNAGMSYREYGELLDSIPSKNSFNNIR